MTRWLLYGVVAVVGVIVLITLIGLMLPRKHRATRVARFRQTPETIFAAIAGSQDWRTGVERREVPRRDEEPRRWTEKVGRRDVLFEEVANDPPRLYRTRIADASLPFGGTWTYEISPAADGGCSCRITEDGEVSNPIFRFVGRFLIGHTRTIEEYLRALGMKFDETISIEE
jgi:hypothetical protein